MTKLTIKKIKKLNSERTQGDWWQEADGVSPDKEKTLFEFTEDFFMQNDLKDYDYTGESMCRILSVSYVCNEFDSLCTEFNTICEFVPNKKDAAFIAAAPRIVEQYLEIIDDIDKVIDGGLLEMSSFFTKYSRKNI